MSEASTTYVGLDVHKSKIVVAMLRPGQRESVVWTVSHTPEAVRRMVQKLRAGAPGRVLCGYEAGACGYALQRQLISLGVGCQVVAPSQTPVKPGDRVKTDRRDARKLAELLRAGLLTEVHPPTPEQEAARDLVRCRADAQQDLTRARHRLSKYLLRHGVAYTPGRKAWTKAHRAWLYSLRFELEAAQSTFTRYLAMVEIREEEVAALDAQVGELAAQEPYHQAVGWLRCFHGIETLSAMTILTELHGFGRFSSPRALMSYLGLVPSESSSGNAVHRGRITKAGNQHARRLLVQIGWHYQHTKKISAALRGRRRGQPAEVVAIANRAHQRLSRRFFDLHHRRGVAKPKVVVAVARELVGFLWAVLYLQAQPNLNG